MSLSFTTRKRIRPEMIRKTNLDGVCLVYSGTEERSTRVLSRAPSKALSNASINEPSNASNDEPINASNDEPSNASINEPSNSVITQQPANTIQPTDTIPKTETDDVVMDTLEFDCFLCYRWWFCYK